MITMAKRGHKDSLEQLAQMGVDPRDLEGLSGDMMEFQLEAAKRSQEAQSTGDLDTAEWNALVSGYSASLADLDMSPARRRTLSQDMATVALTNPERAKELMRALDHAMRRGGAREQAQARMDLENERRKTAGTLRRKSTSTHSSTSLDPQKRYELASEQADDLQDNLTNAEKRFDTWKNARRDPTSRRYRELIKALAGGMIGGPLDKKSPEYKAYKKELETLVEPFKKEIGAIRVELGDARKTVKLYRDRLGGQTAPTEDQIKAAKAKEEKAKKERAGKKATAAKVVSGVLSDDEAEDSAEEVSLNDLVRAMKLKVVDRRVGPSTKMSNEEIADFLSDAPFYRDRQEVLEALASLE